MERYTWREPREPELGIIGKLLSADFPGKEELRRQIVQAKVRTIDDNGSIEFSTLAGDEARVTRRIPVEGEYEDIDGVTVHILLFVVNGLVDELEIHKEDGSQVVKVPEPGEIRLFCGS
jgi:hypothetical protein